MKEFKMKKISVIITAAKATLPQELYELKKILLIHMRIAFHHAGKSTRKKKHHLTMMRVSKLPV